MRINFSDRQQFERLEDMAIDGHLDYSDFPPEEYTYFSKLARLGYMNRHKGWPGELCEQLHAEYREEYEREREKKDAELYHYKKLLQNKLKVSELRRRLNFSTDIKQVFRFSLEIVETLTGETGFADRITNKFKEDT